MKPTTRPIFQCAQSRLNPFLDACVMRNCSAAELAVRATLLWVRIELRAFAFTRHPASPRPHAVNEENAALRKAIARRRRRADRGAREGADGPELTQRSRRAGSSSRPVLGSKTQTAPRRRCAPPALAPLCRPAAETRARSRVRRASRHASAGASLSPPPNKWCLAQSGSQPLLESKLWLTPWKLAQRTLRRCWRRFSALRRDWSGR